MHEMKRSINLCNLDKFRCKTFLEDVKWKNNSSYASFPDEKHWIIAIFYDFRIDMTETAPPPRSLDGSVLGRAVCLVARVTLSEYRVLGGTHCYEI